MAFAKAQLPLRTPTFWLANGICFRLVMIVLRRERLDGLRMAWHAYKRGRAADDMVAQDWVALLELPLEEVRRRLNILPDPTWQPYPVRSA